MLSNPDCVRKRSDVLLADARKRGASEETMRGVQKRLATDLPDGKPDAATKRAPMAWWAGFVLSGEWR